MAPVGIAIIGGGIFVKEQHIVSIFGVIYGSIHSNGSLGHRI